MVPMIIECLASVRTPRFFDTERGYQGELLAELRARLPQAALPGDAIVEQEYQKRLRVHGIEHRPDLIIHVPAAEGDNRHRNNFAVFELKLKSGAAKARKDFAKLDRVLAALDYPLGVFVNIASTRTYAARYDGRFRERLHFFAVRRVGRKLELRHDYYRDGEVIEAVQEVA